MLKVINTVRKLMTKLVILFFESRVWMAYTESKTWGHILKQGKKKY